MGQVGYLKISKDGKTVIGHEIGFKGAAVIPDGVTMIDNDAFSYCDDLTSIQIPYSVIEIENAAFDGCSRLKEIVVDNNNIIYCSEDGVLYSKYMSRLITVPEAKKSLDIPNGVTEIGERAFNRCINLLSIKIPSSMTEIGGVDIQGVYRTKEHSCG